MLEQKGNCLNGEGKKGRRTTIKNNACNFLLRVIDPGIVLQLIPTWTPPQLAGLAHRSFGWLM